MAERQRERPEEAFAANACFSRLSRCSLGGSAGWDLGRAQSPEAGSRAVQALLDSAECFIAKFSGNLEARGV